MKRTTIMLPDDLDANLRLEARRRRVPVAVVAREILEREFSKPGTAKPLSFVAMVKADAGPDDVSERHHEFVARAVEENQRRIAADLRRADPRR